MLYWPSSSAHHSAALEGSTPGPPKQRVTLAGTPNLSPLGPKYVFDPLHPTPSTPRAEQPHASLIHTDKSEASITAPGGTSRIGRLQHTEPTDPPSAPTIPAPIHISSDPPHSEPTEGAAAATQPHSSLPHQRSLSITPSRTQEQPTPINTPNPQQTTDAAYKQPLHLLTTKPSSSNIPLSPSLIQHLKTHLTSCLFSAHTDYNTTGPHVIY